MSRDDKLVEKLKRRPTEASFDDVCRLLELYGWVYRKGGEHNAVYAEPGGTGRISIATVKGRAVKRYIITQVLQALGLDDEA